MQDVGVQEAVPPQSEIDALTARHEAMLLRLVGGATARAVALEFGMSEGRLSILRGSPMWREAESKLRRELREDAILQLESLRGKAIEALYDTVQRTGASGVPNDPTVRLQSARQILDRAGLPAGQSGPSTIQAPVINLYIPPAWRVEAMHTPAQLEAETL